MPGVELRRDWADRRGLALNAALGVAVESVTAMAETLLLPGLILAFFVAELTPSYVAIGLVPAVAASLWTLARVPALLLTSIPGRQQPWAFGTALIRASAIAVLAVVASRTDPVSLAQSGRPLLVTCFLCLIVFSLAGGFGSVPTSALLRSSVSGESWERFVQRRSVWSMALSIVAALVALRMLGSDALLFPGNFGRLFLVTTVCLVAVAVFIAAMREGTGGNAGPRMQLASPRSLRQPLYDARYRRFLVFRILLSATSAIDPFLFLYAVTRLGIPITAIGSFLLAGVLGWVVSAPMWVWLERRSSARATLQSAAVLRLVAPAIALVLPQLAGTALFRERLADGSWQVTAFAAAFFTIGAAMAAQARGNSDYLTPMAPDQFLSAYSALTNGVLVVVAFSPVLGGTLIQRSGYEVLFGAVIAIGLLAVFIGGSLADIPMQAHERRALAHGLGPTSRALPMGRA